MANFNKVILLGNLTRDPQLSYLPSNTPVTEFGMAINHQWSSREGEKREETCFVDCRLYGRQAEVFNQYMAKGRPILVEGRLQYQQWEKEGQKRSKHMVVVDRFQFLGGRGNDRDSGSISEPAPSRVGAATSQGNDDYDDSAPHLEGDTPF